MWWHSLVDRCPWWDVTREIWNRAPTNHPLTCLHRPSWGTSTFLWEALADLWKKLKGNSLVQTSAVDGKISKESIHYFDCTGYWKNLTSFVFSSWICLDRSVTLESSTYHSIITMWIAWRFLFLSWNSCVYHEDWKETIPWKAPNQQKKQWKRGKGNSH